MAKKRNFADGLHQRKDGVWEREERIDGKRRSFSSKDPEEVWRKIEAAKTESDMGPLFREVAERYQEEYVARRSHGTQKVYIPAIVRAVDEFGKMRMREIQARDITLFLKRLSGFAHTTVSNQKTVINGIYDFWIQDSEWRGDYEPCRFAKIPEGLSHEEREPPTPEQLQIVLNAADEPEALPALIFLYTGIRRGEALALQRKDINFKTKQIDIYEAVEHIGNRPELTTPKTKAGMRTLPLLAPLERALCHYESTKPEIYLIGGKERPLTQNAYEHMWATFCRKHGMAHSVQKDEIKRRRGTEKTVHTVRWLPDVTAHQFRHEYITMLFEAGISEEVAIAFAGHADGKTIHKVYLHLRSKLLQTAASKLNEFVAAEHKQGVNGTGNTE